MDAKTGIGERIKAIRLKNNLSGDAFGAQLGMSRAGISAIENGKNFPAIETILKIADLFKEDVKWILTGGVTPVVTLHGPKAGNGGLPAVVTVDGGGRENIVLVNTKAQGGYPTLHQDPEFYGELPVLRLPLERFQHFTYRAWEVVGSSMQPGLHPGSIAISQFVENWHTGAIRNGYIHVIVTKDTVLIKRLIDRRQKGYFGLMSDNEEFATFNLPLEDVQEIWTVTGALVWHFPNTKFEERFKISKLVTDYVDLEERLRKLEKLLKN